MTRGPYGVAVFLHLACVRHVMVAVGAVSAIVVAAASPGPASGRLPSLQHPFAVAQPQIAPNTFLALIEIPEGSFTRYEIDPAP